MYRIKKREVRIQRNLRTGAEYVQVHTTYESIGNGFEHKTVHPISRSEYQERKYYDSISKSSMRGILDAYNEYMSCNEW